METPVGRKSKIRSEPLSENRLQNFVKMSYELDDLLLHGPLAALEPREDGDPAGDGGPRDGRILLLLPGGGAAAPVRAPRDEVLLLLLLA